MLTWVHETFSHMITSVYETSFVSLRVNAQLVIID